MAMDVDALMMQSEVGHHNRALALIGVVNTNLVQVGGVINEQAVAQTILTSDDATLMAAMKTAGGLPPIGPMKPV